MANHFDIDTTASSVYGIVGTGIALGALAGTTRIIMGQMDYGYNKKPRKYKSIEQKPIKIRIPKLGML